MPDARSGSATVGEDVREPDTQEIRFVTYLSPSIPRALFEALTLHLQRSLGRERVSLRIETGASGPLKGHECSSFADEVDVAFVCAPSFFWLRELRPPPAELLGAAPVFDDERNAGRPVYFCDTVVRDDAPIRAFSDLEGGSWTYNGACSLSGYYGLLNKLAESGTDESFFGSVSRSGSHLNSIEAILRGETDAAARLQRLADTAPGGAGPPRALARHRILGPVPDTAPRNQLQVPPATQRPAARRLPHRERRRAHTPSPTTIRPQLLRRRGPQKLRPRRPQRPRRTPRQTNNLKSRQACEV
jgi:hypothetical protein